ncbi:MAG: radical SAM family heme chaperone HemW [Bacteroidaceae bacterium]|nr:radical SAM family heme chaperone HemW [Bacteroidaceae bacterium]
MIGIYIHIPFCKKRCIYCGFYSTVQLSSKDRYVDDVCLELKNYSTKVGEEVGTIYIGGGTPSQLSLVNLKTIRDHIYANFKVSEDVEMTIEGNPDDLTYDFLKGLKQIGFNRLSMGVQSFDDKRLQFLHRRHSASQALEAVSNAKKAGFENISIDLMFGFPNQTLSEWKQDVQMALALDIQHLSAYSLMYEDGTLLASMLDRGEITEISDELASNMYEYLIDSASQAGFEHYELSNWSKPLFQSRHNSSYWTGVPYLGVGAAAHSFDGKNRWSNPESINEYMEGIEKGKLNIEYESLDKNQSYDEFIMTGLRTSAGVSLAKLRKEFGDEYYEYCLKNADSHIKGGRLQICDSQNSGIGDKVLKLTRNGLFVSNDVMSDLMFV